MISICPHCLEEASALSFDRRGAPYLRCSACGSLSFLKNTIAMRGMAAGSDVLRTLMDKVRTNSEVRKSFDEHILSFQARLADQYKQFQLDKEAISPATDDSASPEAAVPHRAAKGER